MGVEGGVTYRRTYRNTTVLKWQKVMTPRRCYEIKLNTHSLCNTFYTSNMGMGRSAHS